MLKRREFVVSSLALLGGALPAGHALAQKDFPNRPIRLVVPFAGLMCSRVFLARS
jgi:tripartite-type tricarboxylate transporter receptor subunit TctC